MKGSYRDSKYVLHRSDKLETEARQAMKSKAGSWPVQKAGQSLQDYYDEVVNYGRQESAIIAEQLKQPLGGERPLAVDNTDQRRENWYDK